MSEYTSPGRPAGQENSKPVTAAAQSARERASDAAGTVADATGEVVGTVREQTSQVVEDATTQARDLVGEAREQLRDQARSQTGRLAENVRRLADELREMSEHGKPGSTATTALRQVAAGGHQVADHVERRGPDGLLDDVRDFARRKPGLFLASAAVAGFAIGRSGKGVAAESTVPSDAATPTPATDRPERLGRPDPAAPVPPRPQAGAIGSTATGPRQTGAYEGYGQSQPPHVTPVYGGAGDGRVQPPTVGR
ncbi:hypothetical protein KCMC57_up60500 [Kitasatospora sp. CMC57]|uniref:Uncharacterized protein n=1 Tax=Kitasatospora sp. CMC57 TaxID=3231513 RepID=A0AB33K4G9_9ACTN